MLLEILILSFVFNALKVYSQENPNTKVPIEDASTTPGQFSRCYENLGCISTTDEWFHHVHRPRNLEPLDRHTIRTQFILVNKDEQKGKSLKYDTLNFKDGFVSIEGYRKKHKLIILIHDFTSNGYTGWVKHIAAAYLNRRRANIVSVDWESGAEPPFEQAIANARVVGLEVIAFVKDIKQREGLKDRCIHIIGHGVGAHIAGYVGAATKIGKITGLDPTGPFFEDMPPIVRLDPTDAIFVEVLHTDAFNKRSQGGMKPLGHFDFYLNGAKMQPFCNQSTKFPVFTKIDRNTLKEGTILPDCSHKRSFKYFIEAIEHTGCEFTGFRCKNYEDFTQGKCITCDTAKDATSCVSFGLENSTVANASRSFYLNTNGQPPFCLNPYRVKIIFDKTQKASKQQKGNFEMIMLDNKGTLINASATNEGVPFTFETGKAYTFIYYASPPRLGDLVEVRLKWLRSSTTMCLGFCNKSVFVKQLSITLLSTASSCKSVENLLCAPEGKTEIPHGNYAVFKRCEGDNADPFARAHTSLSDSHVFFPASLPAYLHTSPASARRSQIPFSTSNRTSIPTSSHTPSPDYSETTLPPSHHISLLTFRHTSVSTARQTLPTRRTSSNSRHTSPCHHKFGAIGKGTTCVTKRKKKKQKT